MKREFRSIVVFGAKRSIRYIICVHKSLSVEDVKKPILRMLWKGIPDGKEIRTEFGVVYKWKRRIWVYP